MLTRLLVRRFTSQYCLYKNLGAPNPVQKVSLEPCRRVNTVYNVYWCIGNEVCLYSTLSICICTEYMYVYFAHCLLYSL